MKMEKTQEFEGLTNKHSFTVVARAIEPGIPVYHGVWNSETRRLK